VTKQGTRTYARQTLVRTNPASVLTRVANTCLNVPSITATNTSSIPADGKRWKQLSPCSVRQILPLGNSMPIEIVK